MARPKKNKEPAKTFDLEEAMEKVNPLLRDGFRWFIMNKKITNQKAFDELIKIYGGFK